MAAGPGARCCWRHGAGGTLLPPVPPDSPTPAAGTGNGAGWELFFHSAQLERPVLISHGGDGAGPAPETAELALSWAGDMAMGQRPCCSRMLPHGPSRVSGAHYGM